MCCCGTGRGAHADDQLTTDEVLRAAVEIPQEPPSRDRVLACVAAAEALLQDADPRRAEPWAAEAVVQARALADASQEALSLAELARVRSARDDDVAAVRTAEQAVHVADHCGDLDVLQHALAILGIVQWTSGKPPDDAVDRRRVELLGGDEPGPLPNAWGMASANLAEGLLDAGRWDEAAQVLSRTLAVELPDHAFWSAQRLADHLARVAQRVVHAQPRHEGVAPTADPRRHGPRGPAGRRLHLRRGGRLSRRRGGGASSDARGPRRGRGDDQSRLPLPVAVGGGTRGGGRPRPDGGPAGRPGPLDRPAGRAPAGL